VIKIKISVTPRGQWCVAAKPFGGQVWADTPEEAINKFVTSKILPIEIQWERKYEPKENTHGA